MMEKKWVIQVIKDLRAYEEIKSYFDSFSKKADRRVKDICAGLHNELAFRKNKDIYDSDVKARIIEGDLKLARTYKDAVKKYMAEYPKQGKILQEMIDETRDEHNIYVEFGIKADYNVSRSTYIKVLGDMGVKEEYKDKTISVVTNVLKKLRKTKIKDLRSVLIDLATKKTSGKKGNKRSPGKK